MYSFTTVAISALVASASIVSAAPVACRGKPGTYAEGYLEDYEVYHTRYLALNCTGQHGSTFFDECCHPLLATEILADARLAHCIPSNETVAEVSSTIAAYSATATVNATATASADVDAAAEYSAAETSASAAEATATASVAAVAEVAHHQTSASSSAEEAEPTTSSSEEYVAPSTTSSAEPEATSAPAPSGGDVKTGGFATFFYQGGNAGACGTVHSDSDYVIAIDSNGYWSDFSQPSEYCGRHITITNTQNGKTVTAEVADVCPTCVSDNSLDLSVGAFNAIATPDEGSVPISWTWA